MKSSVLRRGGRGLPCFAQRALFEGDEAAQLRVQCVALGRHPLVESARDGLDRGAGAHQREHPLEALVVLGLGLAQPALGAVQKDFRREESNQRKWGIKNSSPH